MGLQLLSSCQRKILPGSEASQHKRDDLTIEAAFIRRLVSATWVVAQVSCPQVPCYVCPSVNSRVPCCCLAYQVLDTKTQENAFTVDTTSFCMFEVTLRGKQDKLLTSTFECLANVGCLADVLCLPCNLIESCLDALVVIFCCPCRCCCGCPR